MKTILAAYDLGWSKALRKFSQHYLQVALASTLFLLSSCSSLKNTPMSPAQLNEAIKQDLVLLHNNDFEYFPPDLRENKIIFLGEIHRVAPLADAANQIAVYLAHYGPVVYAQESCYGLSPFMEAASIGRPKPAKPMQIPRCIEMFNQNQDIDNKVLMTAIDIEHSIFHNKSNTVLFLQDLANRSSSDIAKQAINEKIIQLTAQDTFDKMNSYLKELKKSFVLHLNTFPYEDQDEILFSMELLTASNRYEYLSRGILIRLEDACRLRYMYFNNTIERAYNKAQKRNAILLCRVGSHHADLNNISESRYFAKKHSPTKGKIASINMVPLYYDNSEMNDTVANEHNDIDSIVKNLMKDYNYSYLSLAELQQKTNNSFKWSKYFSSAGPKYDGLLFVRVEKKSN